MIQNEKYIIIEDMLFFPHCSVFCGWCDLLKLICLIYFTIIVPVTQNII